MGLKIDPVLITVVEPGSLAETAGIRPGDRLVSLNGQVLRDVIDYQLVREADRLDFELLRAGSTRRVSLSRRDDRPIGVALEKSIFDRQKTCANHCVFCFIDQLPPDCRSSLYVKDDDFRLSFLYGNFITLTNLTQADLARIKEQRLSPLYVSIHAADPAVRRRLIGPPKVDKTLANLDALLAAGIEVHLQIVVCPGINDGATLTDTLDTLVSDFSAAASVGIVPVGLTGHRRNLPGLRPFTRAGALDLLAEIGARQAKALKTKGCRWVFAADEFYLMTGGDVPPAAAYDDFPQVENGIGIVRLFIDEIDDWLAQNPRSQKPGKPVNLVTAASAAKVLQGVLPALAQAAGRDFQVLVAANKWLGGQVFVAGLLSGSDIIDAVNAARPTGPVLVPAVCLNPDGIFLDDLAVEDVARATGSEIIIVPSQGWDFMEALKDV